MGLRPASVEDAADSSTGPQRVERSAIKIAAANSRKLAVAIDAARELGDAALMRRRGELQAAVALPSRTSSNEEATRLHDAVEFVCAERGLQQQSEPREAALLASQGPMAIQLPDRPPAMRAFLERQLSQAGSYREGRRLISIMLNSELTVATFATRQLGREQLAIMDAEVAQFRAAFAAQAMTTARGMLDDSSRAIAAALHDYGLPVNTQRLTAAAEQMGEGNYDEAVKDWMTLAHAEGNDGRYRAGEEHREELAQQVERLLSVQRKIDSLAREQHRLLALRAQREHTAHHRASKNPRIDLRGLQSPEAMPALEQARKMANRSEQQVAKLPTLPHSAAPFAGDEGGTFEVRLSAIGEALREAKIELSARWILAERKHPILATYRAGGNPDPAAAQGLAGNAAGGDDSRMRAAMQQILPKLSNILRAKTALRSGDISPLGLPPVVEATRRQMFVPEGSARAGAVHDLVSEASSGGWQSWAIAAVTLAAAVISAVPSAGTSVILTTNLGALAIDVYGAVESYQEYGLAQTLTNTDLDQARSISTEAPELTGLAVRLVSLGLGVGAVTQLFRQAVSVRRLVIAGRESDDAVRVLNRLGSEHGAPGLGDEVAREAVEEGGVLAKGKASSKTSAREATVRIDGLAQTPGTMPWRPNADGAVRTIEEAVELARRWGVEIPEDIAFYIRDPKHLPPGALAEYFRMPRANAGGRLTWEKFLDEREQVAVRLSQAILSSDEAIVAVISHEMHELHGLRALFDERETISALEIARLINPGHKGNLHDQAWDIADALISRMRATRLEGCDETTR